MYKNEHTVYLIKLGENISKYRNYQKISKVQLAFEMETSEKYIRQIEKGKINVGIITLLKLSQTLNIEMKELFDFD